MSPWSTFVDIIIVLLKGEKVVFLVFFFFFVSYYNGHAVLEGETIIHFCGYG